MGPNLAILHLRIFGWGGIWTRVSQLRSRCSIAITPQAHAQGIAYILIARLIRSSLKLIIKTHLKTTKTSPISNYQWHVLWVKSYYFQKNWKRGNNSNSLPLMNHECYTRHFVLYIMDPVQIITNMNME